MSRRRRITVLFACFLVTLVAGTYVVLVYTGASRSIVESVLSRFIRSRFHLRDVELDPTTGRLRIEGVQIGHPRPGQPDVLVADHVELDVNTNPLGGEELGLVRQVRIEKLNLHLSFTDVERWDLVEVLELSALNEGRGDCPAITIADSTVTVRLTEDRPAVEFTAVHLELRPEAEGSSHMVLSGSMLTPEGFEVTVAGAGDVGKGQFQALFAARDLPLRARVARPYSPAAETYLERAGLCGTATMASLWVQYPPLPGEDSDVSGHLSVAVEGVGWTLQEFPYPVAGASGRVSVSTRDGGRVQFDLAAERDGRSARLRGDLVHCLSGAPLVDLLVKTAGTPVDDALRDAIDAVPVARRVWRAFEPSGGHIDADLYLHNADAGESPQLSMDLRLHDVDGRFLGFASGKGPPVGFPYRVEDVTGLIQLRRDKVEFKDVAGRRGDGARAHAHGSVTLGADGGVAETLLDIEAEGVVFSDELRDAVEALHPGGGAIYAAYSPAGKADVEIKVRQRLGETEPRFTVLMIPSGASAAYERFPYRVEDLRGKIELGSTGVAFNLAGQSAGADVDLGGRFSFAPSGDGLAFELWLHGRRLPLDPRLRRALEACNPDLDRYWQQFDPKGTVDCQMTLWRQSHDEELEHDVRLDFHEGSVLIQQFDTTLEGLRGSVFVHGRGLDNQMDVSTLRGEVDNGAGARPAEVVLEGSLRTDETSSKLDLTTLVRGLQLNDRLARKLDRADIVSRATWRVLRPAGVVDLVSHRKKEVDDVDVAHRVRVQLHDVRSDAHVLPSPVTGIEGELVLANERGEFEAIRGQLGNATISADGFFEHAGATTVVDVTLSADELAIDSSFQKLVTGPMQKVFSDRNIRGTLGIGGFRMRYAFPDEGDHFELRFDGTLIASHLSLSLLAQVQAINGTLEFTDGRITPQGGHVKCSARNVSFRVLGHQATNFSADFTARPDAIELHDLEMRMHGGRIRSNGPARRALVYHLVDDALDAQLRWDEMSLTQFVRATGETSPMARGTLSGDLDLRLPAGDVSGLRARGHLDIRDGRLGEVPIFTAIYAYLAPAKRPQFDSLSVLVDVDGERVKIDELELTSSLFDVKGGGTIGLDGYVDIVLEFPDFFAASGEWFILPQILRALTSQVVRFHVFGYLRALQARPRWLFQRDPARQDIGPIPTRVRPSSKKPF